ncbi:MAG: hypothetical protein JWP01_4014 [Myxococcales bacterium]|nr:hypothetical protein [Myxococcales bacterium]
MLLLGLAASTPATPAFAQSDDDEDETADDEGADDEGGDDEDSGDEGDEDGEAKKPTKKAKPEKEEPFVKQNLSGHDLGTTKKASVFEKDRFFVDKVDSGKTEKGTLIQGSLSSSSLLFTERGGSYGDMLGDNSAKFSRMFTELRLQTDFRHIKGGRWEARVDARARVVNTPENNPDTADPNHIQSGFNGTNEYDIREMWLFRSGKRSDIFFGRQFVADLGGVKFDGLRVDYASSRKLTLIGFAGLYPLRGSRSITTDYQELKADDGTSAGKLVGTGGFGGAYRTVNSYGAIGGVVLAPLSSEQPRVFVTSTGYLRRGAALDLYHFALVDLYGSQGAGLTNLSAGANYKPSPRLRLTASVNRVDVDTLAVQANAFLTDPDKFPVVQNETYFRRLATNVGRVGVSAGLGQFQRFEVSVQAAYRYRPGVSIPVADGTVMPASINLQGNKGVDLFASIVDRRSFKDLRLGIDGSRSFGVGAVAFNRSEILAVRAFAGRELKNGHGEWEGEVSYATTKDSASGFDCMNIYTCYGSSTGSILAAAGNLYYRFNRDWFAVGSLALSQQSLTSYGKGTPVADPSVIGVMGYFRASYRF